MDERRDPKMASVLVAAERTKLVTTFLSAEDRYETDEMS
jgi:hypothetical protein